MASLDHIDCLATAQQDQRYVGLGASESLGNIDLAHGATEQSDLCDLICGQKLLESCDQAGIDGVLFVHRVIDPLKVRRSGIRFVAINVIDERQVVWVRDEGNRDDSVNMDGLVPSVFAKVGLQISEFVNARFENLAIDSSWPSSSDITSANPIKTSQATEIADFVKSDEISNASPFFNHGVSFSGRPHFIGVFNTAQGG